MVVETQQTCFVDDKIASKMEEVQKKLTKKIQSAKKAIKLFESGTVEEAYKKAMEEAKNISDEMERNFKVSIIENEQQRNIAIYKAAQNFLKNHSQ
ncbi:MAG: hypothetical protein WCY43_03530 [Patescibacteria group bacterium]|nr:hypothetical protein [Patescibacteria group bacterium]